jgi:hypothetical protein
MMNMRCEFMREWIGARRPDLVVRFGYGTEMPKSDRRSVDDILI